MKIRIKSWEEAIPHAHSGQVCWGYPSAFLLRRPFGLGQLGCGCLNRKISKKSNEHTSLNTYMFADNTQGWGRCLFKSHSLLHKITLHRLHTDQKSILSVQLDWSHSPAFGLRPFAPHSGSLFSSLSELFTPLSWNLASCPLCLELPPQVSTEHLGSQVTFLVEPCLFISVRTTFIHGQRWKLGASPLMPQEPWNSLRKL